MSISLSAKMAAAAGGLALALTVGAAVASADPDPVVNTTCNYSQVVDALNAQSPDAAAKFNASPIAQSLLRRFLAAPPDQRQHMIAQAQGSPEASQYIGLISSIADSCNNY